MHRILFTAALLAVLPAAVHAQSASTGAAKAAPVPTPAATRKSHNPFGEAMLELTRAAREQAATKPAATTAKPGTHETASKPASVPVTAVPADARVLADSNRS